MARDFDDFPTYDELIKDGSYLSNIWSDFFATFTSSLQGYLSQNGMFVPVLSSTEQSSIQQPVAGQLVYISDLNQLQIWQIINNVGQWTVIV